MYRPSTSSSRPGTAAGKRAAPCVSRTSRRSETPFTSTESISQNLRAPSTVGRRSYISTPMTEAHQVICAVSEGRGVTPIVGMAFINITTGEAILSQLCDTQFYLRTVHKIQVFEPSHVLIVASAAPPNPEARLYCQITECPATIVPLNRSYWSETAGLEYIQQLAFHRDCEAIKVALQGNFYATCAFAAAIRYLELQHRTTFAYHSLRIKYRPSEHAMLIDLSTIVSLELIQNLRDPKSKDCLFGFLNETLTPMGARMLRSNILQPSTQQDSVLGKRYDALSELSSKEDMFFEVRKALRQFSDVEKLLTNMVTLRSSETIAETEQSLNNILKIKTFVLAIPQLHDALSSARSALLTKIRGLARPEITTHPILEVIGSCINEEAAFAKQPLELRYQKIYAVRSGVHGLLDVSRQTHKEAVEDMYAGVAAFNEALGLAGDIRYDNTRGFYLRYRIADLEMLDGMPADLINMVRKKDWLECSTLFVVKQNQRIADSTADVMRFSGKIIAELECAVRERCAPLFQLAEGIALLDMIAAFAQIVTTRDYVRPEFAGALAMQTARNPILEQRHAKFIPTEYYATEQLRLQIITGSNMSGKTTYLRTVALLQVMAQIGCFVPADYASFPVVHNLFSRLSMDDSIEGNMSTFSLEMREVAFILRNVDGKSLCIVDELGRGTSTRDGLAIAIAICEALVQSHSLVFFATHFAELARVMADRPGVLNLHLQSECRVVDEVPRMCMTYQIAEGPVREEGYGIGLAAAIGFPKRMLEIAHGVAETLRAQVEERRRSGRARRVLERRKLVLALRETLMQVWESRIEDEEVRTYLERLQKEYVERLSALEED